MDLMRHEWDPSLLMGFFGKCLFFNFLKSFLTIISILFFIYCRKNRSSIYCGEERDVGDSEG